MPDDPDKKLAMPAADQVVDATGLDCPVPLLLTRQAAKGLIPGQVLQVISTDEHTGLDLEAWCLRFGHRLLGCQHDGKRQCYWLVIGEPTG